MQFWSKKELFQYVIDCIKYLFFSPTSIATMVSAYRRTINISVKYNWLLIVKQTLTYWLGKCLWFQKLTIRTFVKKMLQMF